MSVFQEVVCIDDVLDIGLPVGEVGVIIQVETNTEKALKYLVRFPMLGYTAWCTARDLMRYKYYLRNRAHKEILYSMVPAYSKAGRTADVNLVLAMQEVEEQHFEQKGWGSIEPIEEDLDDEYWEDDEDWEEEY